MIDSIHIVKLTSLGSTQSARQYDLTGRLSRDEVKQVVVTSNMGKYQFSFYPKTANLFGTNLTPNLNSSVSQLI